MTPRCATRADAIRWARDLLDKADFLVLDTETTGLGDDAEPVQIGVLSADGTVLLNLLVKPPCPIPAAATAIHGITEEDVADAPPLHVILPRLQEILAGRRVVVYNLQYDAPLLDRAMRRRSYPGLAWYMPTTRWTCAMEPYSAFIGEPGRYGGWKWQRIPGGGHTAISDCRAVLEVIKLMGEVGE